MGFVFIRIYAEYVEGALGSDKILSFRGHLSHPTAGSSTLSVIIFLPEFGGDESILVKD